MKQRINVLLALLVFNFYWIRQSDSQLCETVVTEAIHNRPSLTPYWIKLMTVCSNGKDESCICRLIEKIKGLDEVTITYIAVPESTDPSVTQQLDFWTNDCEAAKNILGIVIGLLMMTLAIVVTGWGWTCWLLKRGAKRNTLPHSQGRVYSARNPVYMQSLSLESNSDHNSHHSNNLEEEEAGESQENVYHILENPAGDDVYEVLNNYEKKEQDEEENVYHILDGPTVIEEEPEGVVTPTSNGITSEDYEIPMPPTSTREDH